MSLSRFDRNVCDDYTDNLKVFKQFLTEFKNVLNEEESATKKYQEELKTHQVHDMRLGRYNLEKISADIGKNLKDHEAKIVSDKRYIEQMEYLFNNADIKTAFAKKDSFTEFMKKTIDVLWEKIDSYAPDNFGLICSSDNHKILYDRFNEDGVPYSRVSETESTGFTPR